MKILQQRIPTILGLLLLISGIAAGVYLVQKRGVWFLRAEPKATPQQIRITNISDNSFTVSWITEIEVLGFVKYGVTPSLTETVVDERDKISGKTTPYFCHHVKVASLSPGTKYYFKIGSGKGLFDNQGKLFEVTTAFVLGPPPAADTVYGTILKPDGAIAEGVLVYLSLANSIPLSALTESSGNWAIPLSVARTVNLSSYITYDPDASVEEIFVQGGPLGTATAVVTTKNDSPVPPITLGKSYDFREAKPQPEAGVSPTPTLSTTKFSLQPLATPLPREEELKITNPEEGEEIVTQNPEIQGTGPSENMITITLESPETFTAEVTINEDGSWSWTPPANLTPGEHTVTVVLRDGTSVSRRFTVLAAPEGEFPAFTATPSTEASPSPTPLLTPSPSPTATPTATPTVAPRTGLPATEEGVPEPGYLTPTFIVCLMGIVLILSGLLLKTKTSFYG